MAENYKVPSRYIRLMCFSRNLLNVLWQPGWEGSLGNSRYMYTYG